ncbi:MAG: hypothetical protein J7M16_13670 [Anaerolineae bacterium]|nr:hypothetical protein [Anaerolineae bacterium]
MDDENSLTTQPTLDIDTTRLYGDFTKLGEERRQRVVHLLRQVPAVVEVMDKLVRDKTYRVVIPPEVLKQLKKGAAGWDHRTGGLLGVTIRDNETGKFVCQVSLKEISPELLSSINQLAIQHALAEIVQRLEVIDQKITDVLQGQRNDRLAIVKSGVDLYQQAIEATDLETRRQLLVSAIEQLNEGRQRLILTLETDAQFINKIPHEPWRLMFQSIVQDIPQHVERKSIDVQKAFQAILIASHVLILAYQELGEQKALRISLQPLEETVREVGAKGAQIARWLPYNPSNPPEELWHRSLMQLADGIAYAGEQLKGTKPTPIEITFTPLEIVGGEAEWQAELA